jgi:hypothetical protein
VRPRELLKVADRDNGKGGDRRSRFRDRTMKLADLGVSKKQPHLAQRVAAVEPI